MKAVVVLVLIMFHLPPVETDAVVKVLVYDAETGEPIEGAGVHLSTRWGTALVDREGVTDENGDASFGVVPVNCTYLIRVEARGYQANETLLTVEEPRHYIIRIELQKASLSSSEPVVAALSLIILFGLIALVTLTVFPKRWGWSP